MQKIKKQSEPICVPGLRREATRIETETGKPSGGADWDPGTCGDAIRAQLCREQLGLCAYCLQRIKPNGRQMKIEHFVPRSVEPQRMYEWQNLLGACLGVSGDERHCDTARGNQNLHINPAAHADPEPLFEMKNGGEIETKSPDAESDCRTLNLNCESLKNNRAAAIGEMRSRLRTAKYATASINTFLRVQRVPRNGQLPPFARFIADYLEKKLRQNAARPAGKRS